MFDLGVSGTLVHKRTPTNLKRVFSYVDFFVTLKGMQLLINKPSTLKSNHVTQEAIKQAQEFELNMITLSSHTSDTLQPFRCILL
jgi:hypothetical protein